MMSWEQRQVKRDEQHDIELELLRRKLGPITTSEVIAKTEDELAEDTGADSEAPEVISLEPQDGDEVRISSSARAALLVEDSLAARLSDCFRGRFDVRFFTSMTR